MTEFKTPGRKNENKTTKGPRTIMRELAQTRGYQLDKHHHKRMLTSQCALGLWLRAVPSDWKIRRDTAATWFREACESERGRKRRSIAHLETCELILSLTPFYPWQEKKGESQSMRKFITALVAEAYRTHPEIDKSHRSLCTLALLSRPTVVTCLQKARSLGWVSVKRSGNPEGTNLLTMDIVSQDQCNTTIVHLEKVLAGLLDGMSDKYWELRGMQNLSMYNKKSLLIQKMKLKKGQKEKVLPPSESLIRYTSQVLEYLKNKDSKGGKTFSSVDRRAPFAHGSELCEQTWHLYVERKLSFEKILGLLAISPRLLRMRIRAIDGATKGTLKAVKAGANAISREFVARTSRIEESVEWRAKEGLPPSDLQRDFLLKHREETARMRLIRDRLWPRKERSQEPRPQTVSGWFAGKLITQTRTLGGLNYA